MKTKFHFMLASLLLSGLSCFGATLTDTQGRSLEATLLLRIGDKIKIQLANGQQFTIPIRSLDEGSQAKIEKWQADQIKKVKEPFRISISTFRENKVKMDSIAENFQTYDSGYKVEVSNRTPMKLDELRFEYIILMEEAKIAARSNKDVRLHSIKGEEKIESLSQGRSVEFVTKTLPLKESKLKSNWTYGVGRDNAVDELKGIWIKVYKGSTLVYEYSRPSNLANSFKWDNPPGEQTK